MKKMVIEDEKEGLLLLIGERVTIFTSGYFYTGKLVGVNDECVKLEDPGIVYETGAFTENTWKDYQSLNVKFWYVAVPAIESFGILK